MVVPESKAAEEITSSKEHSLSSLGRQSSIYTLTLDEFQNSLSENGKINFGSMNMDELLNNIWSVEENQVTQSEDDTSRSIQNPRRQSVENTINSQCSSSSLPRQVCLALPAPLSRKTVEEVWAEIRRAQEQEPNNGEASLVTTATTITTHRQPTFGELTLEDFLIKAGVVKEAFPPPPPPPRAVAPLPNKFGIPSTYQTFPLPSGGVIGETSNYAGNGKRGAVCFGGRVGNDGGAYGGAISPVRSVSSDGICGGQVENSGAVGSQYGVVEMGGIRGRKRGMDGTVGVVVERRQRRMIKNRESAARSRARKQAYTVELEAELNQLKEENTRLKQILAETEKNKRQELQDDQMKEKPQTKAQKAEERLRMMRKSVSFPNELSRDDQIGI